MGKYIWLVVIATVISLTYSQSSYQLTVADTNQRQAQRQSKVIARQVARSGYNVALAEAKQILRSGMEVSKVAAAVDTLNASYEGGRFKSWISQVSPSSYRVTSVGHFNGATHTVRIPHERNIVPKPPTVRKNSTLNVEFIESRAGYCSAIYLQRFVPTENQSCVNGTTQNADSGCGSQSQSYRPMEPELVFAPGNNRDGVEAEFQETIQPGTRLNFIMAVDKDHTCERRGDDTIEISDDFFNHTRSSFVENVNDLSSLHEAPFAMVQERPDQAGTWRVAFEDKVFNESDLWEIKESGYYGNGWDLDGDKFWKLEDFGDRPDFSDQVIEVKIVEVTESEDDS